MDDYTIKNLKEYKKELEKKSNLAFMGCVVSSTSEKPIIGTQALVTCHGILFYDRENKFGLVGHAVTTVDKNYRQVLFKMIEILNDGKKHIIEYTIIPGYINTEKEELMETTKELLKYIDEFESSELSFVPSTEPVQVKLNYQMPIPGYEFAFDTNTGEYVTNYLFDNENDIELGSKFR